MTDNQSHQKPYRLLVQRGVDNTPILSQWILTSPHSGHLYPAFFIEASRLSAHDLRRSEDAHIERLLEQVPQYGGVVLAAIYPRAYLDLNREAYELDPQMFAETLPTYVQTDGARVKAGLGTIARIVADKMPIYHAPLSFAQAKQRIEEIHLPFHQELKKLLYNCVGVYESAYLLDIHSMPSRAVKQWAREQKKTMPVPDIILGDCFGTSCKADLTSQVEAYLTKCGYHIMRNAPYAGGYITQSYGLSGAHGLNVHALQIEISRALYMDEENYLCHEGFSQVQEHLTGLLIHLKSVLGETARKTETKTQ